MGYGRWGRLWYSLMHVNFFFSSLDKVLVGLCDTCVDVTT